MVSRATIPAAAMTPACRMPPPSIFPHPPRPVDELPLPHTTEPTGPDRPFERQKVTESAWVAISAAGTPSATAALKMRAPSRCTRHVVHVGLLGHRGHLLRREGGPFPRCACSPCTPPPRPGRNAMPGCRIAPLTLVRVQHAPPVGGQRPYLHPAQCRDAGHLVQQDVRGRPDEHLVPPLAVRQPAHQVPHAAAHHQQPRLLAHQLRRHLLQAVHRGVLPVHVVPQLRLHHGPPHGRRWLGNRIASQVYRAHGPSPCRQILPQPAPSWVGASLRRGPSRGPRPGSAPW